ncbi:MAG: hypothetical protein AABW99_00185, partial [archaeon]
MEGFEASEGSGDYAENTVFDSIKEGLQDKKVLAGIGIVALVLIGAIVFFLLQPQGSGQLAVSVGNA